MLIDPRKWQATKSQRRFFKRIGVSVNDAFTQDCSRFDEAWCESNIGVMQQASIIVGMHADQATEDIVLMSVKHGVSFAIVPCCVFPRSREKMSYKMWLEHLQSLHPSIKRHFLPFQGRNCVLYMQSNTSKSSNKPTDLNSACV